MSSEKSPKACEWCGSTQTGEDYQLGKILDRLVNWEYWSSHPDGKQWTLMIEEPWDGVRTLNFEMVAKSITFSEDQGAEMRNAFMILLVNGKHMIRKNGYADSYGEVSWTGPLRFAVKREIVTHTWENK